MRGAASGSAAQERLAGCHSPPEDSPLATDNPTNLRSLCAPGRFLMPACSREERELLRSVGTKLWPRGDDVQKLATTEKPVASGFNRL